MHPLNTNIASASASADKVEDDKTKQSQDKAINITEYNYQKYYVNKEKYSDFKLSKSPFNSRENYILYGYNSVVDPWVYLLSTELNITVKRLKFMNKNIGINFFDLTKSLCLPPISFREKFIEQINTVVSYQVSKVEPKWHEYIKPKIMNNNLDLLTKMHKKKHTLTTEQFKCFIKEILIKNYETIELNIPFDELRIKLPILIDLLNNFFNEHKDTFASIKTSQSLFEQLSMINSHFICEFFYITYINHFVRQISKQSLNFAIEHGYTILFIVNEFGLDFTKKLSLAKVIESKSNLIEKYEKQINEKYQANTRWESIYKECVTRSELRYLYRNIERFDKNFCRLYIEIRPYFEVMFNQSPYDESNWKKYIK